MRPLLPECRLVALTVLQPFIIGDIMRVVRRKIPGRLPQRYIENFSIHQTTGDVLSVLSALYDRATVEADASLGASATVRLPFCGFEDQILW